MARTYAEIEREALDIVELDVPEVTDWKRAWTNAGRREVQKILNFEEMRQLYPAEAQLGATFLTTAHSRTLVAPAHFKEPFSERDSLWLLRGNDLIPLELRPQSWLARRFSIAEEAEPAYYDVLRSSDGATVSFELWPKPDQAYAMRLDGYFFQADLNEPNPDGTDPDGNTSDFLTAYSDLMVRDAIVREAFLSLQMLDLAAVFESSFTKRGALSINAKKDAAMQNGMTLVPSLRAAVRGSDLDDEWGYPFWGRR
jgi:hypothetical protein